MVSPNATWRTKKKRPWALFVGRADNRIAVVRRFGDETGRSQILKLSTSWRRRPAWVSSSPQARRV
ncbi:hypothetical protein N0006_30490, partial [Pseudomonas aeruginosa]|nr:hypothetical protein [Pseudomonas aeruginosa]MCS8975951.1 hypothetical protein [Pseudomonas aeruginosa]